MRGFYKPVVSPCTHAVKSGAVSFDAAPFTTSMTIALHLPILVSGGIVLSRFGRGEDKAQAVDALSNLIHIAACRPV